jgi:hypothetical protein
VGDFKIGNLSLTTNDNDIGLNLALSGYPWVGGLIALDSDWATLCDQLPFNETTASIETDLVIGGSYGNVAGVRILYNDGFQTSEFFYEQETGILLRAETQAGSFSMTIWLNQTSLTLQTTSMTSGIIGFSFISIVVIGCISFMIITKKRK